MSARWFVYISRISSQGYLACLSALLAVTLSASAPYANAQGSFSSGSDGSDGALDYSSTPPGTTVYFDPVALGLKGSQDQFCVYNFTTITIPANVTVKLSANKVNCPVFWLAQGNVSIAGTLDLSGATGGDNTLDVDVRVPAAPGSGGYGGGIGGNSSTSQNATAGNGPGGGAAGVSTNAGAGGFTDNQFLVPLVGGSGGGGGQTSGQFGAGGGAGGGAILIASSTQIAVNGTITANGGSGGYPSGTYAQGGSGGAIRLVSNTVTGSGLLSAIGGEFFRGCNCSRAAYGRVRLEAFTISAPSVSASLSESNPLPLFLPTAAPPSVQVTSINGTPITENPFSFPDITINTGSPVPLVITAHQVPVGTVPVLYIFSEGQDQQGLQCTGGLTGTLDTSTCSMNITYPFGGSRGFVKATWTQ